MACALVVVTVVAAGGCGGGRGPVGPAGPGVKDDGRPALVLTPIAKLGKGAGDEVSGIVRSRRDPTVFWTLNDSGDGPRVYPVRADGAVIPSAREPKKPGTEIGGAINGDWEDIALDASGRLIVADVGNNSNARADLCLYFVEEPEPTESRTTYTRKVLVRYPEQRSRPAPADDFNYDCEGVFTVGDEVYLLTKNRSDTRTAMYRLASHEVGVVNDLERLGSFDVRGRATGADASDDGLNLVILTYDRIWLIERPDARTPFFGGRGVRAWSRGYRMEDGASDSEAVCFETPTSLLIADESRGMLYRVPIAQIRGE